MNFYILLPRNSNAEALLIKEYKIEAENTIRPILYSSRPSRLQIFCRLALNLSHQQHIPFSIFLIILVLNVDGLPVKSQRLRN